MRYLLDRLHTELLTLLPTVTNDSPFVGLPHGKSTIVTAIFGGILQNEVNCLICGMESKKHDPFLGGLFMLSNVIVFAVKDRYFIQCLAGSFAIRL